MDCSQLEWNPLNSAEPHSSLAGVLAGLVFAGIVVLVGDRSRLAYRHRSLMLLTAALFSLAFDAFIFSVIAGEQVCARAWTITMPAADLLGVGSLGIFGGLSWLFHAYGSRPLTEIANFITYAVALIVGSFIQVNAVGYLDAMRDLHLIPELNWLYAITTWWPAIVLTITIIIFLGRWGRSVRLRNANADADADGADFKTKAAAYLMVAHVLAVAVISGWLEGLPRDLYEPATPPYVVVTATLVSLVMPTFALLGILVALPLVVEGRKGAKVVVPPQVSARGPGASV
jgi:hypothetical protein